MNEDGQKIVDFNQYCHTCKYKGLTEDKDPCDECLACTVNTFSHKPVKYEES